MEQTSRSALVNTARWVVGEVRLERIEAPPCKAPAWLTRSLVRVGLLHPVILLAHVGKTPGTPDYKVIAGRKRVAAARALGWETIRAQVAESGVGAHQSELLLHENLHRGPSPILEAEALQAIMGQGGLSQREVARLLGISQPQVSQRLALLLLVPKARDLTQRGEIPVVTAQAMAKLPPEEQEALLAQGRPTQGQIEAHRRELRLAALGDLPLPPPPQAPPGPQPPSDAAPAPPLARVRLRPLGEYENPVWQRGFEAALDLLSGNGTAEVAGHLRTANPRLLARVDRIRERLSWRREEGRP